MNRSRSIWADILAGIDEGANGAAWNLFVGDLMMIVMHAHDHADGHEHHGGGRAGRRLLATIAVSGSLMIAETVGGVLSGSLALLADAGHMLTDVLALLVAFGATALASRKADERRTYGYRRLEILAALANGVALVVISVSIA